MDSKIFESTKTFGVHRFYFVSISRQGRRKPFQRPRQDPFSAPPYSL